MIDIYNLLLLLISPVGAIITWYIRGFIERNNLTKEKQRDSIREYNINLLESQIIDFYWPMLLSLTRYKAYNERYEKFKNGNFSLSSNESSSSDPQLITNMPEDSLNKYISVIDTYKKKMLEVLLEVQERYTLSAPKAEPDKQLVNLIIELDEYIQYVISMFENEIIINSNLEKHFPNEILILINNRLYYLQECYNNLIYENKVEKIEIDHATNSNRSIINSLRNTIRRRNTIRMRRQPELSA